MKWFLALFLLINLNLSYCKDVKVEFKTGFLIGPNTSLFGLYSFDKINRQLVLYKPYVQLEFSSKRQISAFIRKSFQYKPIMNKYLPDLSFVANLWYIGVHKKFKNFGITCGINYWDFSGRVEPQYNYSFKYAFLNNSGIFFELNHSYKEIEFQLQYSTLFIEFPSYGYLRPLSLGINYNLNQKVKGEKSKISLFLGTSFFKEAIRDSLPNNLLSTGVFAGININLNDKNRILFMNDWHYNFQAYTGDKRNLINLRRYARMVFLKRIANKSFAGIGIVQGFTSLSYFDDVDNYRFKYNQNYLPNNPDKGVTISLSRFVTQQVELAIYNDFMLSLKKVWEIDNIYFNVFYHLK